MTTTPTTDLQGLLSAKKAELTQPQLDRGDVIDVNPDTGEIVPAASAPATPSGERQDAGAALSAAGQSPPPAPVEVQADYSFVPAKVLGAIPFADGYWRMARRVCRTDFVPMGFRGNPEAIVAAFMRGYEMGFPPMQALDSFNVIQGSVGLKAEAMRALIMDAGHQIILEDVYGDDGQIFAIEADCHRKDWPADKWRKYRYSMDDALTADLLRLPRSGARGAWQKMPRAMLDARATSGAGRRYFADVLAGMSYTPEEIRDFNGPAEQEAPPSRNASASSPPPLTAAGSPDSPSDSPTQPPPLAPALEDSSANGSTPPPDVASTDTAPATSPEDASTAPATPPPSPKKASGSRKKAAASSTPAPSSDAPPAPPPAGSTPLSAQDVTPDLALLPTEGGDGSPMTSPEPPATSSASDQPGQPAVLSSMRSALSEIIKGLPQIQQPLCRAFIRQHFPSGIEGLDEAQVQKCIDIAVGWPDSADQHPLPEHDDGF